MLNAKYMRAYYLKHKVRILKNAKQYRLSHSEQIKNYKLNHRLEHKNKYAQSKHAWYIKNRKIQLLRNSFWKQENYERWKLIKLQAQRRRVFNILIKIPIDVLLTLKKNHPYCEYCGSKENLTFEHIIPLSRCGKHEIENLTIACAHCNFSKNNKLLEEWCIKPATEEL